MAKPCVLPTVCRVPLAAKEPRTAVRKEDIMTADALKKITTDALDKLATLLDEGHSDQLTALLKTMARFHKYSWHNVCLIASQCPTATRVARRIKKKRPPNGESVFVGMHDRQCV